MKLKEWAIASFSAMAAIVISVSSALAETVEVNVDILNVRTGPGTNYSVLTQFDRGVRANRIKQEGNWAYIVTGRVEGWVFAPYVRVVADSSTSDPSLEPSYEANGRIENARHKGTGKAEVRVIADSAIVKIDALGENIQPFSVTYYGVITSNANNKISLKVNGFKSLLTNERVGTNGNGSCQLEVDPSKRLLSAICQAPDFDHGRTVFTRIAPQ